MSYEIEYRHLALSFSTTGIQECWERVTGKTMWSLPCSTLYVVLAETGSSNTFTRKVVNGREKEVLSRKWSIAAIGSEHDVIAHACRIAPFAHSGMVNLRNRGPSGEVTPEAFIRHYRTTLKQAVDGEFVCPIGHRAIRFFDQEERTKSNPWFIKARETGRLVEQPSRYQRADEVATSDSILNLGRNSQLGSLACDLHALSELFTYHGNQYPHLYFHDGDIDYAADEAYDRMNFNRKCAA